MVRCPVCESVRVVIVVAPARRAFCIKCGSRWVQEGSLQRSVRPSRPSGELASVSKIPSVGT